VIGIVFRICFLGLVDSLAFWAGSHLLVSRNWLGLVWLIAATATINFVYISKRSRASKWLLPGTLLLLIFQIYPILFTASAAFSNYSTAHFVSRDEAASNIVLQNIQQVEGSPQYSIVPLHNGNNVALLVTEPKTKKVYLGSETEFTEIDSPSAPTGWKPYTEEQFYADAVQTKLGSLLVPIPEPKGAYLKVNDFSTAFAFVSDVIYDTNSEKLIRVSDQYVFPEREGAFIDEDGTALDPGWRVSVGFKNFKSVITDPLVRGPFLRVLIWTFVYAALTVLTTFALGLTLALILNHTRVKGRKYLRSVLIIPYAVPGFLSLMIWAGLLNDDFGTINALFHSHIPWLTDPVWAKVSTLLVNLWLGFPYMFLICTGAIQSIPAELSEAAEVDGAKPRQILMKIKLPLLLVTVSPLLIGSFAYSFNNFGGIYLLTGGGPPVADSQIAGATDILISYTYKLAMEAGHGNDYGLACAISILIFFMVAGVATLSFTRTRALENLG